VVTDDTMKPSEENRSRVAVLKTSPHNALDDCARLMRLARYQDGIQIVGDEEVARENWHSVGPHEKMRVTSRMQHSIYWGWLHKPLRWSLKTRLAPWSYLASIMYDDWYRYLFIGRKRVKKSLKTGWGILFDSY